MVFFPSIVRMRTEDEENVGNFLSVILGFDLIVRGLINQLGEITNTTTKRTKAAKVVVTLDLMDR